MRLQALALLILALLVSQASITGIAAAGGEDLFVDTGYDLAAGYVYSLSLEVGYKSVLGMVWAGEAKAQIGPLHAKLYLETSTLTGKDTFYLVVLVMGEEKLKAKIKELGVFSTGSDKVSAVLTLDAKCSGNVYVKYNGETIGSFTILEGAYYDILEEENGDASVDITVLEEYNCESGEIKDPPNLPKPSPINLSSLGIVVAAVGVAAAVILIAFRGSRR